MTSVGLLHCPDTESFFEAVVESLRDILSREELLRLLTEVLNRFVAEDNLSREEADVLHEYLNELNAELLLKDQDTLEIDPLDKERFLKRFPRVKRKYEDRIGKLRALADMVDKVHRGCTISKVAAISAGAVSGLLTIIGLALAPVTAEVSLALLATGLGLGVAAAVTTSVDHVSRSSAETEASCLRASAIEKWKVVKEVLQESRPQIFSTEEKLREAIQCIEMIIHVIELIRANPGFLDDLSAFLTTGQKSLQSSRQVHQILKGTALAMSKGAWVAGGVTEVAFLLVDLILMVKESEHLHEGTKTEVGKSLRQRARELERSLDVLTRTYESLS